jgi:23S rRNA pseudoU1915 N3-methylase RlmH
MAVADYVEKYPSRMKPEVWKVEEENEAKTEPQSEEQESEEEPLVQSKKVISCYLQIVYHLTEKSR